MYLDSQFKGKTTAELNGYIIENVIPGNHLIKVEKEGYTPFEETISVKPGEVFSYKVKPFVKHTVTISEQGNAGESDKRAAVQTGKLVIQSVPIEVKITIPQIDGVNNTAKTKDQWIADDIPAGTYAITFRFNDKTITKTVSVEGEHTTNVFVNMLNGSFTANTVAGEQLAAEQELIRQKNYLISLFKKYKFRKELSLAEFFQFCPEAKAVEPYGNKYSSTLYAIPDKTLKKKPELVPGYTWVSVGDRADEPSYGKVYSVEYTLMFTKDYAAAKAEYDKWYTEIKKNISDSYIMEAKHPSMAHSSIEIWYNLLGARFSVVLNQVENDWFKLHVSMQMAK